MYILLTCAHITYDLVWDFYLFLNTFAMKGTKPIMFTTFDDLYQPIAAIFI